MAAGLLAAAQARAVRQPVLQPVHMGGRGRPAGSTQRLRMTFRPGICESNQRPRPGSCLPGSGRGCKQQHRRAVHLFMTEDARAACCRVALEPPSAAGRLGCEAAPIVKSPRDPRCTGRQTFGANAEYVPVIVLRDTPFSQYMTVRRHWVEWLHGARGGGCWRHLSQGVEQGRLAAGRVERAGRQRLVLVRLRSRRLVLLHLQLSLCRLEDRKQHASTRRGKSNYAGPLQFS